MTFICCWLNLDLNSHGIAHLGLWRDLITPYFSMVLSRPGSYNWVFINFLTAASNVECQTYLCVVWRSVKCEVVYDWFVCSQLETWLEELRQENCDEAPDSLEAAERQLEECARQRDSCLDACVTTIGQGETLIQELGWVQSPASLPSQ